MPLNEDQKDWVRHLNTLPAHEKCECGWYLRGQCPNCDKPKPDRDSSYYCHSYKLGVAEQEIKQLKADIADFLKAADRGWLGKMPEDFNESAFVKALRLRITT